MGERLYAVRGATSVEGNTAEAILASIPHAQARILTGHQFFPHLISGPFHHGLTIVFTAAALMAVSGAAVSWMRGKKPQASQELSEPVEVASAE